jgi:glycine/D-amino acid oxidase-like deaminating enzyme/nitrite reductase/ring-hydroxylating ferredoxin subunit
MATQREKGRTTSIWMDGIDMPSYAPLSGPVEADVGVVGAGISGLTTAYILAKAGKRVVVVDHSAVGGGDTGRTTAQVTAVLDNGYAETEQMRGRDGARLAAMSHMAAIDLIERIAADEGIDCDFARIDGYIFPYELTPAESQWITDEHQAARRAGLPVELVGAIPLPGFPAGPAVRYRNQAHFHPLKYLAGLARALERMGARIYTGSHISAVRRGPPVTLETPEGHTVSALSVVLATHAPINDALGYSTRIFPYQTYVVGLRVPKGSVPATLLFDTDEPYHYVRIQPGADSDTLIVGGEDHKTGQADDQEQRYERLERWTRERFPMAAEVTYRWSGEVFNSFDGLALIGADLATPNVYVITGQTGMGMTHGTIGGMVIADLILGRPNPWIDLYDPARVPPRALSEVLSEGLNVAAQYGKSWLTGGDVRSEDDIKAGDGAVVGWGATKVAAYRDEQGVLHRRSALCTHLGCVVGWNGSEKTWDCPCHGSRYDAHGRVISGPAPTDLSPADD